MLVNVTQEDIDAANRMRATGKFWPSNNYCPISRAVKRAKSICYAWVTPDYFTCNGSKYWLPPEAMNFVDAWDDFCEVKPFSFEAAEVLL